MSTRTEAVYDELRRELLDLSGQFEPGQRLKLLPLAERFDASQSVIREALTRLAEQGLVVATPQHGFSVRELSVPDLADLTRVRVQVESLALRQAIQSGDVAWEAAVVAAHHTLDRTPVDNATGGFNEDWAEAHRAFHQTLRISRGRSLTVGPKDQGSWWRDGLAPVRSIDVDDSYARPCDRGVTHAGTRHRCHRGSCRGSGRRSHLAGRGCAGEHRHARPHR